MSRKTPTINKDLTDLYTRITAKVTAESSMDDMLKAFNAGLKMEQIRLRLKDGDGFGTDFDDPPGGDDDDE